MVCKAATRYVRKRMGSLSPASSESQAAGRSHQASHSLISVVFPKPAGAEMRISLRCSPSLSCLSRRGRLTIAGRSGGTYSFVARMGVGMPALYPFCGLPCSSFLHVASLPPGSYSSGWFDKIIIEDKMAYVKVRFTRLYGDSKHTN